MEDDNSVVQSERVSYGMGTKKKTADDGLIRYLMRHRHTTPFEMCEIKFHIKLPIFVARQWIRHRTANVNEYSARYSIMDREFYLPEREHLVEQSEINNQGRGRKLSTEEEDKILETIKGDSLQCYDHYIKLMNREEGSGEIIDKKDKV